jgi:hypothetical protein
MKVVLAISYICFWLFVLGQSGCEQAAGVAEPPSKIDTGPDVSAYTDYTPAKIHITPLTEISSSEDAAHGSKIDVYVSLVDAFGSQIKSPGIFRFEAYEHVQRSASPRGSRAVIWPDIDLTQAAENSKYWQDFLRTYKFHLDFNLPRDHSYVLQVTFLSVGGRRLCDEFVLKGTE